MRIETRPCITMRGRAPSGIHSARCGGTTQRPAAVSTVITPADANSSWFQPLAAGSTTRPAGWVTA